MQNDNQSYWAQGVKDPRTPVGKIKLSDLMNYDDRCSYKHKRLWEFHLSWSHSEYAHTSLASVRKIYDEMTKRSPTGQSLLSIPHISKGNRDLCEWGYIELLEKGKGRNASRFSVNWNLLELAANGQMPSLRYPVGNATDISTSVYPEGNSGVTQEVNATDVCVYPEGNKDLSNPTRVPDTETGLDRINDCSLAAVGLVATAQPQEKEGKPFDTLYNAYGVRKKRAEAKLVFDSIVDEIDLEELIASAQAWRDAWVAQGKPDAPRKYLHTWLRDECFLEDAPTAYKPKPQPHGSNPARGASQVAVNDNKRSIELCKREDIITTIAGVEYCEDEGEKFLAITFAPESGLDETYITYQSAEEDAQKRGQVELTQCLNSLGLDPDETDPSEWKGMQVRIAREGANMRQWLPKVSGAA